MTNVHYIAPDPFDPSRMIEVNSPIAGDPFSPPPIADAFEAPENNIAPFVRRRR